MDITGLALCTRYSYPPNSLSLCGPDKQEDLKWYSSNLQTDKGTVEILSQFSTLFPYLRLIATSNNIKDPFDKQVIEAYWLGNNLLHKVSIGNFVKHLSDSIQLKKKIARKELESIFNKISIGALPHHAFHVLNIYKRTGHLDVPHTVETMDACMINWGKIKKITPGAIIIETKPLKIINNQLGFGPTRERIIMFQGEKDILFAQLKIGDWISSHWGYFCQKLTKKQLNNLIYYTQLSIRLANALPSPMNKIYINSGAIAP